MACLCFLHFINTLAHEIRSRHVTCLSDCAPNIHSPSSRYILIFCCENTLQLGQVALDYVSVPATSSASDRARGKLGSNLLELSAAAQAIQQQR